MSFQFSASGHGGEIARRHVVAGRQVLLGNPALQIVEAQSQVERGAPDPPLILRERADGALPDLGWRMDRRSR